MKRFDTRKWMLLSGIIIGLCAALLAYLGNPKNMAFCTACFIRDIAGSMHLHNTKAVQYFRPEIVGLVIGSFVVSVIRKEFFSTAGSSTVIRFFLGTIMMVCALVFLGCPLRMVLRMSSGDLSAYIGFIGFIFGVASGVLFIKKGFSLGKSYPTKQENGYVFPIIFTVTFVIFLFIPSIFLLSDKGPGALHAPLIISLIVGIIVGVIAQKSRMCFAGSIRNIIMFKDFKLFYLVSGLFVVMLIYNLIVGDFKFVDFGPVAHAQSLWNILSMYAVGFSAVLLGGCPLRQLILSGTGSGDSVITIFGMFFGASISHNFKLASKPAVYAAGNKIAQIGGPNIYGKFFVIISILVLILIAYKGIKNQKTFK